MSHPAVALHLLFGSVTLLLYWSTLTRPKGGGAHRRLGRWFVASWGPVLASVGLVLLWSRAFAPEDVIQFVYLSVCVVTVCGTAWLALRWKGDLARFRGPWFRRLGGLAFGLGLVVLAAGFASRDPLTVLFSTIGLIYGGAMLRFAWAPAVHPRWSLIWHLNGMCYLFNAVHGTFAAVAWRHLVDASAGDGVMLVSHGGTMAIALALRLWFGARYRAPLRLTAGPAPVSAAA